MNAIFSKAWHCGERPVHSGPTQDERGKRGNMEFSILGVVVVVISKNIHDGLDHRDGLVEKVFAKQAEGLGSQESMWKPAEMAAAWK